ncbi:putative F-box protein At2g02030 [Silene latifolia]|uniref:putative F-box protein At2g02030 n=1 Tax=Silene latifolia TaxID=37657 RepID=UPI003D78AF4C
MELNVEQKIEGGGFKRRNCNTSAASFADFPEEIQINILSRLPPEIFSRCKFVSKHWNASLTIQTFMFRHALSYDKHSKVAFVIHKPIKGSDTVLSFELSDNKNPNRPTMTVPKTTTIRVKTNKMTTEVIKGHHEYFSDGLWREHNCNVMSNICNDLICLFNRFPKRVGLLSLRTREFIALPPVPTECAGRVTLWYALGFDPVSNVYKVLSIYGGSEECCTKAAIFTIGSKHWKLVEYNFVSFAVSMNSRYWKSQNRFCLDGVIYWVNDNEIDDTSVLTVVAFDLNLEVFTDYTLDTIPIKDVEKIRYYLTSLKGRPTLFIWKKESDEIQQLTLFNHENPKVAWNRRSFIAHDFPKKFSYGCWWNCVAGGSILLRSVKPIKSSVKPEEQDDALLSWYIWYDLEKLAIE